MTSSIRQVQRKLDARAALEQVVLASGVDQKAAAWLLELIDESNQRKKSAFPELQVSKRRYPGEAKAAYLVGYFGGRKSKQQMTLLRSLRILQKLEDAVQRHDVDSIHNDLRPQLRIAYNPLLQAIARLAKNRANSFDIHEAGLVIHPTTPESLAALAILLLEKEAKLNRIRECPQCGARFYARFQHQKFCGDNEKKCQWKHYHSPEWRKKHREQNRKHQQNYRRHWQIKGRGR